MRGGCESTEASVALLMCGRQTDMPCREILGIKFVYESKGLWRGMEKGRMRTGQRKRKEIRKREERKGEGDKVERQKRDSEGGRERGGRRQRLEWRGGK